MCPLISLMADVMTWSSRDDRALIVGGACFSSKAVPDRSRRNGRESAPKVREMGRGISGVDRNLTWCFGPRSNEGVLGLSGSLAFWAGRREEGASKRRLESRLIKFWSLDNKSSEAGRPWGACVSRAVCRDARNEAIDLCAMRSGSSCTFGMVDLVDCREVNPRP